MAICTIDDNNITTAHSEAPADGSSARFDSQRNLAKATAEWPVSRLAETWNKLPIDGLTPVKELMDRKTAVAREGSKKAIILAMLRHPDGATLKRIMEATGWQPHTVRGFISGAIGKQLGLTVESTRTEQGERRYRLPA